MTAGNLLTCRAAAKLIGVPERDLRSAAACDELEHYRIGKNGRGIRFEVEELDRWRGLWFSRQGERAKRQSRKREREIERSVMGWVYFIGPAADDPVKVGWALEPHSRVMELQTGCWRELLVLGRVEGRIVDERALHRHLCEWRYRGEWFEREPALAMLEEISAAGGFHEWRQLVGEGGSSVR